MKLGTYLLYPDPKSPGASFHVINQDDGALLEQPYDFVLGKVGEQLMNCGLFEPGQLSEEQSYLVVVVPCDGAYSNSEMDDAQDEAPDLGTDFLRRVRDQVASADCLEGSSK